MIEDKLSFAQVRNRAEQTYLAKILQKIELEKQSDMRLFNVERKQFRSKYSRMNLLFPVASKEACDQNAHDSQNPGICFRSSGENRIVYQVQSVPSLAYKQLHDLVFTDSEVDVHKVLCLHLISAHRSETLTPPKRKRIMCKEHSPQERLLDRSKRGYNNNEKLTSVMPFYTIEPLQMGVTGETIAPPVINDGRFAARILVNEKLRSLLRVVINGLEKYNSTKLQQIKRLAHNEPFIRQMLLEKRNLEFFDALGKLPLVTSCESFALTPPFKIKSKELYIKTPSGSLEEVIRSIRQNVLQLPGRCLVTTKSEPIRTILRPRTVQPMASKSPSWQEVESDSKASKDSVEKEESIVRRGKRVSKNFIAENIKQAAKAKKIEYDKSEEDLLEPTRRRSSPPLPPPQTKSDPLQELKTFEARMSDMSSKSLSRDKASIPSPSTTPEVSSMKVDKENEGEEQTEASTEELMTKRKSSIDSGTFKYSCRKSTCPACMERWKAVPPTPKTPSARKTDVPTLANPVFKTNSINRISLMINKEKFKLEAYDRKFSSGTTGKGRLKKGEIVTENIENTYLNPMDLARIEQEIREKETEKKLQRFLSD